MIRINGFVVAAVVAMAAGVAQAGTIKSAVPTTAGGTLIDFEAGTVGNAVDAFYAGSGVVFSTASTGPDVFTASGSWASVTSSGRQGIGPTAYPTDLTMSFASGQSSVEFFFSDGAPLNSYTITARDIGGGVLESFSLSFAEITGQRDWYLGFLRGGSDIYRVDLTPTDGAEGWIVDDLRFSGVAVPLPGSAWMGMSLLGILAVARKRRNRQAIAA